MPHTVLVVDDYPDARYLLSYLLTDAGFHVVTAENGPEAIAMARRHRPAAIVMDLHLPGMTGIEATERLRADADLAGIPVIAHTLSPRPLTDEQRGLFREVFGKPTEPEDLIGALRRIIAAHP